MSEREAAKALQADEMHKSPKGQVLKKCENGGGGGDTMQQKKLG